MHAHDQLTASKLIQGATECGLAGQRKKKIKAAQPTQFAVCLQAIYQGSRGLQVQYRLG